MISDVIQEQYAVRTFIEEAIHDGKIGLEAGFPGKIRFEVQTDSESCLLDEEFEIWRCWSLTIQRMTLFIILFHGQLLRSILLAVLLRT